MTERGITLRGYYALAVAVYVGTAVIDLLARRYLRVLPMTRLHLWQAYLFVFSMVFVVVPAVIAAARPARGLRAAAVSAAAAFTGHMLLLPLELFVIPGLLQTDLPRAELLTIHPIEALMTAAAAAVLASAAAALSAAGAVLLRWRDARIGSIP